VASIDIDPRVRRFILENIHSVEQLETLLLLHGDPVRWWTALQVSTELYTSLPSADNRLRDLAARKLLVIESSDSPKYRFEPEDAEASALVDLLANTYRQRRVTVITLVFSQPQDAIRDLADAFRIGKGRTNG
jgi:hypothetical protein